MREITRVILHCSATPDYPEGHKAFDIFGAEDIRVWHTRDNGWKDIGYHLVIRKTGALETGRPIRDPGAHTYGENLDSIGVCLIGTQAPTEQQIDALADVYLILRKEYGIEHTDWYGHYEFTKKKTCPGIPMELVRGYLKNVGLAFE